MLIWILRSYFLLTTTQTVLKPRAWTTKLHGHIQTAVCLVCIFSILQEYWVSERTELTHRYVRTVGTRTKVNRVNQYLYMYRSKHCLNANFENYTAFNIDLLYPYTMCIVLLFLFFYKLHSFCCTFKISISHHKYSGNSLPQNQYRTRKMCIYFLKNSKNYNIIFSNMLISLGDQLYTLLFLKPLTF